MKIKNIKKIEDGEISLSYAEKTWKELLAFQGYGFCKAHASSYSMYSAVQMWLQQHYFIEYMCSLLSHIDRAKEKKGHAILEERIEYCIAHGVSIYYPNVNTSNEKWQINAGGLLAPLSNIKGFGDKDTEIIRQNRPYNNVREFMDKTGTGKGKFESLLFSNALSDFGDIETLYNWYYNEYSIKGKKKKETEMLFDFGDDFSKQEEGTHVSFTNDELIEKCFEMNGFNIDENLRIKYHEIYEKGYEYFKTEEKGKIFSISELINKSKEKEEKAKKTDSEVNMKESWILAKIKSIAPSSFKSGQKFINVKLTDGVDYLMVRVWGNVMPYPNMEENAIFAMPMYYRQDGKWSISSFSKKEIQKIN